MQGDDIHVRWERTGADEHAAAYEEARAASPLGPKVYDRRMRPGKTPAELAEVAERTRVSLRKFKLQNRHHRGTLYRAGGPPMTGADDSRLTSRLRLEPVGPANASDLWLVHDDDEVWPWYGNEKPRLEQAEQWAKSMGDSWRFHGVHKWIAYDRVRGEVVGRGGLSRTPVDDDWGQIYAFLPQAPWVRAAYETRRPFIAHASWLEIGWALRREFWGRGYASEIGRAGLAFAFDVLGVQAVVSCTVRHNMRSRAVMERIGMRYAGEIRSRGMVEGVEGEQYDAPFAVCVLLRREWDRSRSSRTEGR
jgi:RimJ/RimL family protein N-acetyltransferase